MFPELPVGQLGLLTTALSQALQTMTPGPNLILHLFLFGIQAKNDFTF